MISCERCSRQSLSFIILYFRIKYYRTQWNNINVSVVYLAKIYSFSGFSKLTLSRRLELRIEKKKKIENRWLQENERQTQETKQESPRKLKHFDLTTKQVLYLPIQKPECNATEVFGAMLSFYTVPVNFERVESSFSKLKTIKY